MTLFAPKKMKHELEHFTIGDSYGGNQDWFPTFMMHIGGCGAETACDSSVYFALHRDLKSIAPENAATLTRRDYVRFAYKMKPYLSPRRTGIDRLDIYIDGFSSFLRDHGVTDITLAPWDGENSLAATKETIKKQIDEGWLIPCLTLKHGHPSMDDYVWHWYILSGYEEYDGTFMVKVVTYGTYRWLDLDMLWNTGYDRKGGLILFS